MELSTSDLHCTSRVLRNFDLPLIPSTLGLRGGGVLCSWVLVCVLTFSACSSFLMMMNDMEEGRRRIVDGGGWGFSTEKCFPLTSFHFHFRFRCL